MLKYIALFLFTLTSYANANMETELVYEGIKNDMLNAHAKAYMGNGVPESDAYLTVHAFNISPNIDNVRTQTLDCLVKENITYANVEDKRKELETCLVYFYDFYHSENKISQENGLEFNLVPLMTHIEKIKKQERDKIIEQGKDWVHANTVVEISDNMIEKSTTIPNISKCLTSINQNYLEIDFDKVGDKCFDEYKKQLQQNINQVLPILKM